MPFARHVIEPKFVCHRTQAVEESRTKDPDALQEYSNFVLSNLILQISSIANKANTIFGDILEINEDITKRIKELKARIDNIEKATKELNPVTEEVGHGFGGDKKAIYREIADHNRYYQADMQLDTGLFRTENQPKEVTLLRQNTAEAMPQLHLLDIYRTDNKLSAKIYSNPDLFFLAWQNSLQQMIAEQTQKSQMSARKTVRQTRLRRVKRAKPSRIQQAQKLKMGVEFVNEEDNNQNKEEDEYYDDEEEWSSSDDEQSDGTTNGNGQLVRRLSRKISKKVSFKLPSPITVPEPMTNGDVNMNEEFHPPPDDDFLPLPPSPLSPLSFESLTLSDNLPPPMPDEDYSGVSADYNIQSMLDSINAIWTEKT